jgi:ribosomal protein S7
MDRFKYFMRGYFNMSFYLMDLEQVIYEFRDELEQSILELIKDLENIMENAKYEEAKKIIKDYGMRIFSKRKTEEFIRHLHARLKNKKPRLTLEELFNIR